MSSITYQVTWSSDGRPHVSVTSDDPEMARQAIPWLAQTYATLLKDAKAVPAPATPLVKRQAAKEPPICAVHQVPMVGVQGRKGPFWSCHARHLDGRWCSFKPRERAAA
jgi:hypothetical protein